MNEKNLKCSLKNHKEADAILFCTECKIYMCNKCEKLHSELFPDHVPIKIEHKINQDLLASVCQEKNHRNELNYFCKKHNKLCCIYCISKIKNNEIGQHSNCDVCFIEEIEEEKKKKLEENIKILEELSNNLKDSINASKLSMDKINDIKESIKKNIQQIFTKLRNELNNREDKLMEEVDKKFNDTFLNENILKQAEKLPDKIVTLLEKGKKINKEWENFKKNEAIIDCLNIENNIITIKKLKEHIKNNNNSEHKIKFNYLSKDIDKLIEYISTLGNIEDEYDNKSLFDSKIEFEQKLFRDWLNNKKFKSELLFRKSRDGSKPEDFHNKCDNKGNTITIIETTKGNKFGGYTELQWDKSEKFKKDKSTFIFSLNNKEKYLPRNNNDSIYCSSSYGSVFGCDQADIAWGYNNLNKGQCYKDKTNTFLSDRILTNGDELWETKEVEVFKIIYI